MKRMTVFFSLLTILFCGVLAEVEPNLTFTAPANNSWLPIHSTTVIRWTHSAYYDAHPGHVSLVIGDTSFSVSPTADQFEWIVGKRADGTFLPAGQHVMSMEDVDYWSTSYVKVNLYKEAEPNFTFTAPANNSLLQIESTTFIRWTHSAYYDAHPGNVSLVISDATFSVPVTADQFEWVVGRRPDGTFLPVGQHVISMEDSDYWSASKVIVNLFHFQPVLTLKGPADNSWLPIHSTTVIRWTHSAYYDSHPGPVSLVIGDANFTVQATADRFEWTVGRRADGTSLPMGRHAIRMKDADRWSAKSVDVNLCSIELSNRRLVARGQGGLPVEYSIDPGQIQLGLQGIPAVNVSLFTGQRLLADLGEFSPNAAPKAVVKLSLPHLRVQNQDKINGELRFSYRRQSIQFSIPVEVVFEAPILKKGKR